MTVEYTHEVATGKGFGNFAKLLFRWKGSIYKLVLPDLILYMFMYAIISCGYRFGINTANNVAGKETFEKLVKYCGDYAGVIPVSFVLGFYVSQIVTRWWNQFMTIPWPDNLAIIVATSVHGHDDRGRLMRRTLLRYVNLAFVMTMRMMSSQAKSRFPTMDHLVEAGFMMPHEKLIIEALNEKTDHPKYWIPLVWAGSIATRARKESRISDDVSLVLVIEFLCKFRTGLADLIAYDWVCIPIVYTQVVTLAVYLYFYANLLGKQFIQTQTEQELDLFIPVFLFLEYFFYMGWLKVAETMVNPFGEDDDDFEVNWLIDRNFVVSYIIVDEMHSEHPEMVKDQYWDEVVPESLPYTEAALKFKIECPQGSAALAVVQDQDFVRTDEGRKGTLTLSQRPSKLRGSIVVGMEEPFIPGAEGAQGEDQPPQESAPKVKSYAHLMERKVIPKGKKVHPETDTQPGANDETPGPSAGEEKAKANPQSKKHSKGDSAKTNAGKTAEVAKPEAGKPS